MEDLRSRIDKANNKMLTGDDPSGAPIVVAQEPQEAPQPALAQDYYQMQANDAQMASQHPTGHGSPAQVSGAVNQLVEDMSEHAYRAYKNQYEHLIDVEDKNGASRTMQEYMMQYALPMLESLVEAYGAGTLLRNPGAMEKLDSVMLTGNGAGNGFTKAYLKQMHAVNTGPQSLSSDIEVSYGIQKLSSIADQGSIREAVALAKSLKDKVDNGELSASEEDYGTLSRVANSRR